jgi:dimethylglycine dehydrogenase
LEVCVFNYVAALLRAGDLAIAGADSYADHREQFLLYGDCVGFTTSGGYGHCVDKSLAMGYVTPEARAANAPLNVAVVGEPGVARVLSQVPLDPQGHRMRS